VRRLAKALLAQGHKVSRALVAELLNAEGYSLQANQDQGGRQPSRSGCAIRSHQHPGGRGFGQQPVISVDTKKKELVGDFRNDGREYRPQGLTDDEAAALLRLLNRSFYF